MFQTDSDFLSDGDNHKLKFIRLKITQVEAGAYKIWWNDQNRFEKGTVATGVGVSSFTAEIGTALAGLTHIEQAVNAGWSGRIRLITENRSLLQSLEEPVRQQQHRIQEIGKSYQSKG